MRKKATQKTKTIAVSNKRIDALYKNIAGYVHQARHNVVRSVNTDLGFTTISNMQNFLLELGKGFAFVGRQKRLTLDGDHFYADLVFYNTFLHAYLIVDIKTKPLTHADLGQMQLYVNYFDMEVKTKGDNPTIGLILCAKRNNVINLLNHGYGTPPAPFAGRRTRVNLRISFSRLSS